MGMCRFARRHELMLIKLSVVAIGYKAKLFHLHGEELWESAESVLDHF